MRPVEQEPARLRAASAEICRLAPAMEYQTGSEFFA